MPAAREPYMLRGCPGAAWFKPAYTRLRDGAQTFIPVNIIGNLYVSNGMAAVTR